LTHPIIKNVQNIENIKRKIGKIKTATSINITVFFGGSKWNTSSRVGKIVHRTIFACVSAGSSPARNLATSFSIPHFQKN